MGKTWCTTALVSMGVWLWAGAVGAQEIAFEQGLGPDLNETMRTGLVPLFTAIFGGMIVMGVIAALAVLFLRTRTPRLSTNRWPSELHS